MCGHSIRRVRFFGPRQPRQRPAAKATTKMTTHRKRNWKISVRYFMLELACYAALVVGYFLLVLKFMGDSLLRLYQNDRSLYAAVALGLMICQGLGLEILTRSLIGWLEPPKEN